VCCLLLLVVLGSLGASSDLSLIFWHCPGSTPLSESCHCVADQTRWRTDKGHINTLTRHLIHFKNTFKSHLNSLFTRWGLWLDHMEDSELQVSSWGPLCDSVQVSPHPLIHLRHFIRGLLQGVIAAASRMGIPSVCVSVCVWVHILECGCMDACSRVCVCLPVFNVILTFPLPLGVISNPLIKSSNQNSKYWGILFKAKGICRHAIKIERKILHLIKL